MISVDGTKRLEAKGCKFFWGVWQEGEILELFWGLGVGERRQFGKVLLFSLKESLT